MIIIAAISGCQNEIKHIPIKIVQLVNPGRISKSRSKTASRPLKLCFEK
jgi:hypothetical protein